MLLFLILFFSTPLLVVAAMYWLNWHPAGSSRGDMVVPPKAVVMPDEIENSRAAPAAAGFWQGQWSMVYIADQCDAVCSNRLHDIRQIHASLAKDIPRVQRVLITASTDVAALEQRFPDMHVFNQPSAQFTELVRQFDAPSALAGSAQRVYLVDPLGYWMMSYPIETPARDIRKDMGRLLAYAWAG